MKPLLNTLFVTTQNTYLAKDGETVNVRCDGESLLRVPIRTLDGIVAFGVVSASPALMGLCAEHDVTLSFLTENGRFLARVQGPVSGNVRLRREQYRRSDDGEATVAIARGIVAAKIINSRSVLQRALRDHPDTGERGVDKAAHDLARLLAQTTPP